MITNGAVALRRLKSPGHRGPLVVAALLTAVVALPDGALHSWLTLAGGLGEMLVAMPVEATSLLLLTLGFPLLLIAVVVVGATVSWPLTRPRRPGTSALLGIALGCAAVVLGLSVPGQDYGLLGVGVLTLIGLPFAWLLWQQRAAGPAGGPAGRWRWAVAPLLVAATVLTVTQYDPAEARFALARPTLTDWAEHALTTGQAAPEWVAGYRLTEAELADNGVKFAIAGSGMFAHHGYAYFPSGAPAHSHYTPLGNDWYEWSGPDRF
ncbi:hypothetical protein [Kitasatospora sp. CB02891]|uniref:hypothetical protein n=1 Tax=Kitasatospora sp. CB02891 TaxID=2020329 RepID=UPI000C272869|nr:hypothetical protein [Kitasatospora sp. CB02891]PJN21389.1 hypothetical protein CG736_34025 [Kitasatospora sp. CB02891]